MTDILNPMSWTFDWPEVAISALTLALGVVLSYLLYHATYALIGKLTDRSDTQSDDLVMERIRQPIKWAFLTIGVSLAAQANPALARIWEPLGGFLQPALLGWIAFNFVRAITAIMELRIEAQDPVAMRSRRTRIALFSRTATIAIVTIAVGLMLFNIPSVKSIGTTMLASAGLVALAVGAAAQPTLKSVIAGLQVALTDPVRIGDLVVVDGHTGRVEDIRLSFVAVRAWDERLIVVPTTRFLDETFENWSRRSEALTGPVMLHLDPAAEVEPIRQEFLRYLHECDRWDGRTGEMLMTEAYPESIELRLAMSAKTIAELWKLRCAVREHMLAWIRENQEGALIRHRLEVPGGHPKAGEAEAPVT